MPLDRPPRSAAIALLVAAAGAGAGPAQGAAPGYEVQLGVIESDNIQRVPTGGTSATVAVAEAALDWHDKRSWLDVDFDANVSYLDYFPSTYSSQFIGNVLGAVKLQLVPDLLSWKTTDNFGQVPLQPLAPITPSNQQNINYFGTGPTLTLPLGRTNYLDMTASYGNVTYQVSPLNSSNWMGGLGFLHELSPASSISLNAKEEGVRFQNDQQNPNYDIGEAFVRFAAKGARTEIGIDAGASRMTMTGYSDNIPLGRIDVTRHLSPNSTIGVALGHDFSDGADAFRIVQGLGGATLNTQPIVAAAAPFVGSYGTLAWNFQYVRTTLNLSASYFRDRYPTESTQDNDRTVISALAARQVTPHLQLALREYLVRWQFDTVDQNTTESDTGLQLTWNVGRRVSVSLAYFLAKGSSNIPTSDYTENRFWLSIGYGQAAQAAPGPAPVRLPGRQ